MDWIFNKYFLIILLYTFGCAVDNNCCPQTATTAVYKLRYTSSPYLADNTQKTNHKESGESKETAEPVPGYERSHSILRQQGSLPKLSSTFNLQV